MTVQDHNRLIAKAAESVLAPLGCVQKGRSRIWMDDHGWWVGVIEFQPSAWSKGSYLNVGACWLWYEKDYLSFDDGSRVESFHQFESVEQFQDTARSLAEIAADEVAKLRQRFPSLKASAAHLRTEKTKNVWGHYHAGVSAGLVGDINTARKRLTKVTAEKLDFPWVQNLKKCSTGLLALVDDTVSFRAEIALIVDRSRELLKLSRFQGGVKFDA